MCRGRKSTLERWITEESVMKDLFFNGSKMPPCMIGTWAWGNGGNGSRMVFGKTYDVNSLKETFNLAVQNGFVFWDTAEVYGMGNSEKLLGEFIKDSKEQILLSTKYFPGKKYEQGKIAQALQNSVSRLQIDAPDIYWLHNSNHYKENMEECILLLKQNKIKSIGLSNFRYSEIVEAFEIANRAGLKISGIQNHFSLLHYTDEQKKIVEWCDHNDVIYFAYMVLEQGALSGKYDYKNHFPLFSTRNFFFGKSKFRKINSLIELIRELGKKYNVDPSQIPIAWAINKNVVPIVGLTSPSHVTSLAEGVSIKLSDQDIEVLEQTAKETNIIYNCSWEPS